MRTTFLNIVYTSFLASIFIAGCSKSGPSTPADPCNGVTVVVNGTVANTSGPGINDGSISATASGASGFTFSINGGSFQASGNFANLAPGNYSIIAKSAAGCTGTGNFTVVTGDPCVGKTITVSATKTDSDQCGNTGTVTITAAGGTGFTYRLNASGTYQAGNVFNNVATGTYTGFAKDAAGCEKSVSITVGALPNGALFTAAKNLIVNKCGSCHIAITEGGISFATDCNIVNNKAGIKAQAVDASNMPKGGPALTADEKKILNDWLTAGGLSSL